VQRSKFEAFAVSGDGRSGSLPLPDQSVACEGTHVAIFDAGAAANELALSLQEIPSGHAVEMGQIMKAVAQK
jgi:hypothetical protein